MICPLTNFSYIHMLTNGTVRDWRVRHADGACPVSRVRSSDWRPAPHTRPRRNPCDEHGVRSVGHVVSARGEYLHVGIVHMEGGAGFMWAANVSMLGKEGPPRVCM